MKDKAVVFFDGVCNLCNSSVNFIIDRDKKNYFEFAALQSDVSVEKLRDFPIDINKLESIVLLKNGKVFTKSSAALHIAKDLSGGWPLFFVFMILPKFFRDFFYNLIAKNRYRLFGKLDECRIPTPELKEKFIG